MIDFSPVCPCIMAAAGPTSKINSLSGVIFSQRDFGLQYRVRTPTGFSVQRPFEPAAIEDLTSTSLMTEEK
jgi:hypothetical protein